MVRETRIQGRRAFLKGVGGTTGAVALSGCLGSLSGSSDEVQVGAIFPQTGGLAQLGNESLRGVELAVEKLNGEDGMDGREINLVTKDAPDTDAAVSAAESLASVENVDFIVGTYSSSLSVAASQKANQQNKLYFELGAVSEDITARGLPNVVRTNPGTPEFAGRTYPVLEGIATDVLGKSTSDLRVALLHEESSFGASMGEQLNMAVEEGDPEVVEKIAYPYATSDLTASIQELQSAEPDLLIHTGYDKDLRVFMRGAVKEDFVPPIYAGTGAGFSFSSYANDIGDNCLGVLDADTPYYNSNPEAMPGMVEFFENYQEKHDERPLSSHSNLHYTGFLTVADIVAEAGEVSFDAIKEAATNFEQPFGTYPTGWGYDPEVIGGSNGSIQNKAVNTAVGQWQQTQDLGTTNEVGDYSIYSLSPEEYKPEGAELKYLPMESWGGQ